MAFVIIARPSGGADELAAAPTLPDGKAVGEQIVLLNRGTANLVLSDESIVSGSKLHLQTATITLVPDNSLSLAWDGAAWYEVTRSQPGVSGPVSVKDFGAVGDGVTNDRAAIQAAIDYAESSGKLWVHFPDCAESYRCDGADLAPEEEMFLCPDGMRFTWSPSGPIYLTGASFLGADEAGYYNDWVCFRVPIGGHDVTFEDPIFYGENGEYDGTGFLKIEQSANACIEFEASTLGDNTHDCRVLRGRFYNLCGFSVHSPGVVTHCEFSQNVKRYCANGLNVNAYHSVIFANRFFQSEGIECAGEHTEISHNIGEKVWGAFVSAGGDTTSFTVRPGMNVHHNNVDIVFDGNGIFLSDACCMGQAKHNTVRRAYGLGIFSDTSSSGVPDVQNWGNALDSNVVLSCGGLASAYGGAVSYTLGQRVTNDGWTWVCRKAGTGNVAGPLAPTADPYTYRRVCGTTVWGALNVGSGSPNKLGMRASGSAGRHSINNNKIFDLGDAGYEMLSCIGINGPDMECVDNQCLPVAGQLPIVIGSSSVVYVKNNTNLNGGLVYNIIAGAVMIGDTAFGLTTTEYMFATQRYEEVHRRFGIQLGGKHTWGSGSNAEDVSLDRLGVGILGTAAGEALSAGGGTAASAILQASSTTKGFLPPVMTTTQRNAIASPATGLIIFNSTTTKLETWDGATWQAAW